MTRKREISITSTGDIEKMAVNKTADMAWDGINVVYSSFDIDRTDCSIMPETSWPEPGGI